MAVTEPLPASWHLISTAGCRPCPVRDLCTTSQKHRHQLTVHPRQIHHAQQEARARQDTTDWQAKYRLRAGIEATIRQAVAVTGTRRARYRGLAKTHLEHVYTAVALNLIRLDAWWNDRPWTTAEPATSPSPSPPKRINQQDRRIIQNPLPGF